MLVITRELGEAVYVGEDIKVVVVRLRGGTVGLGIEAPKDVKILRQEIADPELRRAWGDEGREYGGGHGR